MTVGAISNTALLDPSQTVGATSWQTRMQQALGPVAQLFGESAQQLMSDLQSGQTSLSALAKSKGISQTDLVNAIKQGLQQSSANGGPQLSDTQLTNLANTIANRVHGHHHHGGGASAIGSASGATSASGVATDSDGDNDGSGSTGSSGATSTSSGNTAIQTDLQRLMFDLQSMLQSSASTATTSGTTSSTTTNANRT